MKNIIPVSIIAMSLAVLFISCTKEVNTFDNHQNDTTEEMNPRVFSYTIPQGMLVKELNTLMAFKEKGNTNYDKATIRFLASLNQYEIIIADRGGLPTEIVCSGNGVSFASCVDNWFEEHPDDCLIITYNSGNDTYYADDDC